MGYFGLNGEFHYNEMDVLNAGFPDDRDCANLYRVEHRDPFRK